ncbi:MAG: hypothetical protein ACI83P_002029 [Janthinobacterium sp.]|jgi:hypothetical protein
MTYRDGCFALMALTLSAATLTGMVHVDAYTHAAQTEASAYAALTHQISNDGALQQSDAQVCFVAPRHAMARSIADTPAARQRLSGS